LSCRTLVRGAARLREVAALIEQAVLAGKVAQQAETAA
jgi:hypothetical protein